MNPHYALVARRANHRCEYCHAPEAIFNISFDVEHIFPESLHGTDDDTNLALACRACNLFKSDHLTGIDETTGSPVRLYHPRHDRWEEHFQVDLDTGIIRGLTPTGRATVERLQMNNAEQLRARHLWIRLRLFP